MVTDNTGWYKRKMEREPKPLCDSSSCLSTLVPAFLTSLSCRTDIHCSSETGYKGWKARSVPTSGAGRRPQRQEVMALLPRACHFAETPKRRKRGAAVGKRNSLSLQLGGQFPAWHCCFTCWEVKTESRALCTHTDMHAYVCTPPGTCTASRTSSAALPSPELLKTLK